MQEAISLKDFVSGFMAAILNGIAKKKKSLQKFQDWIFSMRPRVGRLFSKGAVVKRTNR